jgi:dolichol-phosphate mannosyltransferase
MPGVQVLVADSSSDGTKEAAITAGAKVLTVPALGKGHAVRAVLPKIHTPLIVMADADGTYPPIEVCRLCFFLLQESCTVWLGSRAYKSPRSMTRINAFGNWALSTLASLLYLRRVPDVCTGLWGMRTPTWMSLELESSGFTLEAEIFSKVAKKNCRIGVIPIRYLPRADDSQAKLRVSDGFRIGWYLIRKRINCGRQSR